MARKRRASKGLPFKLPSGKKIFVSPEKYPRLYEWIKTGD